MKVFRRGYALTDEDLVFAFTSGGDSADVDNVVARVYYLDASEPCERREMSFNNADIRYDTSGKFYWLDAKVSNGMPLGSYEIAWIFELDGVTRMAIDEFSVVKEN